MFIKALVRKLNLVVFSPGDFAMEEGEIGEEVYFLSRGTVAIIAGERHVATLSGGDCFGEIALLTPTSSPPTHSLLLRNSLLTMLT